MDYQQAGGLYRKVTAVATAGEMGQLFTVYEKNWHCPDCRQENYASRSVCH
jgi:rubredoxin